VAGDVRDKDTLAAILASLLGFTSPDTVQQARRSTVDDGTGPLDRLESDGALTFDQRHMVEAIVAGVVQNNDGNLDQTLSTLGTSSTLPIAIAQTLAVDSRPVRSSQLESRAHTETLHLTHESPGRYEVRKEIGRGGQARVMLATDRHIERDLAWKEMLSEVGVGNSGALSAGGVGRDRSPIPARSANHRKARASQHRAGSRGRLPRRRNVSTTRCAWCVARPSTSGSRSARIWATA
jgi:hypothetical protein